MKKLFLLAVVSMLTAVTVFAQTPKVNTDSIALAARISENQLKLGKLQNQVDQKTKNKQDAATQAQKSANENSTAANNLTTDPDNRKLARQADNKASDAKGDARTSRKETRRLDNLNSDINSLKAKIADDQLKMTRYTQDSTTVHPQ